MSFPPHDKVDELICATPNKNVLHGDTGPFGEALAKCPALGIWVYVGEADLSKGLADLQIGEGGTRAGSALRVGARGGDGRRDLLSPRAEGHRGSHSRRA